MKKLIITLLLAFPFFCQAQTVLMPPKTFDQKAFLHMRLGNNILDIDSAKRWKVNGIPQATIPDVSKSIRDSLNKKYFPLAVTSDFYNAGTTQNPVLGLANAQSVATPRAISAPTTITNTDRIIVVIGGTFTQIIPGGVNLEFYNIASGTVTLSYNGATLAVLPAGSAKNPQNIVLTWFPTTSSYILK